VFRELAAQGLSVPLDQVSLSGALSSCTAAGAVKFGRQVHAWAAKLGLDLSTPCVSNALLDMYTRCGCSREALALFNSMDCRDVVTWNIVIRGYIHENRFIEACMQFQSMVRNGVLPDDVSFSTALQASACVPAWALWASLHASIVKTGFLNSRGLPSSPCIPNAADQTMHTMHLR
jgi:pentatricopeptide repeat protein